MNPVSRYRNGVFISRKLSYEDKINLYNERKIKRTVFCKLQATIL